MDQHRRQFMSRIGSAMLVTGIGSELFSDLALSGTPDFGRDSRLHFGKLESLVELMQSSSPTALIGDLADRWKRGEDLKTWVAAGALANARSFGGQDYVGFHTFMALAPAYRMSQELPSEQSPLPVMKVLFRNTARIQEFGGRKSEVLRAIEPEPLPSGQHAGEYLQSLARKGEVEKADAALVALSKLPHGEAFNHLQYEIDDEVDVHRIVLAWRAYDAYHLVGEEWGNTVLRQSIRYCATTEKRMLDGNHKVSPIRDLLPKLLDQYGLIGKTIGQKVGDDAWIDGLSRAIFRGSREQAADAVAQSLAEGFSPESIGEAISIAANRLVLHDPGRPAQWANEEKPEGSCHGDSVGVHASDAANAWRNVCRVSDARNVVASLIVGGFHTGGQSGRSTSVPLPEALAIESVQKVASEDVLGEMHEAIRAKDQNRSAALATLYGDRELPVRPILDLLLGYATSEDGALHAEKYYHTVVSEYATIRPAFRWGQIVALARVTASEFGRPSPGYLEAKNRI